MVRKRSGFFTNTNLYCKISTHASAWVLTLANKMTSNQWGFFFFFFWKHNHWLLSLWKGRIKVGCMNTALQDSIIVFFCFCFLQAWGVLPYKWLYVPLQNFIILIVKNFYYFFKTQGFLGALIHIWTAMMEWPLFLFKKKKRRKKRDLDSLQKCILLKVWWLKMSFKLNSLSVMYI